MSMLNTLRRLFHFSGPLSWHFQDLKDRHLFNYRGSFGTKTWYFHWSTWSGFRFTIGVGASYEDNHWQVNLGLVLFSVMFSFHHKWLPKPKRDHEVSLRIMDYKLFISLWASTMESSRGDRHYVIRPLDLLFGSMDYTRTPVGKQERYSLPFPEKSYEVTFDFYIGKWKRPRLPFSTSLLKVEFKCAEGILVPGKGESDYNCGDDRVYGITMPIERASVELAIDAIRVDIFRTRKLHGSGEDMYVNKSKGRAAESDSSAGVGCMVAASDGAFKERQPGERLH